MSKDDDSGLLERLLVARQYAYGHGLRFVDEVLAEAIDHIQRLHRRFWLIGDRGEVLGEGQWRPFEVVDEHTVSLAFDGVEMTKGGTVVAMRIQMDGWVFQVDFGDWRPWHHEERLWLNLLNFRFSRSGGGVSAPLIKGEWSEEKAREIVDKLRAECAAKENRHAM